MNGILLCVFTFILLAFRPAAAVQAQDGDETGRTTRDGVFSSTQVERGRAVYSRVCAACHTRSQFSREKGYQKNWQGRSFFDVFEQISTTMPQDNPGGIPRRDYIDVLSYLLSEYGYPTGDAELPATESGMRAIRIVAPVESGDAASSPPNMHPTRSRY
jgi:mono/diheme cytochrome c family protein